MEQRLTAALAQLPSPAQEMFELVLNGTPYKEIASALKVPMTKVYKTVHNARQQLSRLLMLDVSTRNRPSRNGSVRNTHVFETLASPADVQAEENGP